MIRRWRRGVVLAAVAAAIVVAGVLLAVRPWSGETLVQEAAAGTITYRLCDTVVEAPLVPDPPGRDVLVVSRRGPEVGPNARGPSLEVQLRAPAPDPTTGITPERSLVIIDPMNGTVQQERYSTAAHTEKLGAVVSTVRVEPLDPATAPWPYTEASQLSSEPTQQGAFEFREPDPASGILASLIQGTGDRMHVHVLRMANCRSTMEISAVFRTGTQPDEVTVTKDIHPDDEAAFKMFQDTVVVKGLD